MHLEQWPPEVIELNRELATGHHPELEKTLSKLPADATFADRIAEICTYCDVAVDGLYTSDQIIDIIDHALIPRLRERRKSLDTPIVIIET